MEQNQLNLQYRTEPVVDKNDTEAAAFKYSCECKMCYLQANQKYQLSLQQKSKLTPINKTTSKGYTWLLEKLGEISIENTVKINIPDVAVFKSGHPAFMLQYLRDRSLKLVQVSEKLKIQEVIKSISTISRSRKREEVSARTNRVTLSSISTDNCKDIACLRYTSQGKSNEFDLSASDEEGALRIMTENEFMSLMWERNSSSLWKKIAYIQSILKCKNSIGETTIHFNTSEGFDLHGLIKSGFEDNEDKESKLYNESPDKYSEFIFAKIYQLLEHHASVKLLAMKTEFVKDENGRVWIVHASDIVVETMEAPRCVEKANANAMFVRRESRAELMRHLEIVAAEPKNARIEKLEGIMRLQCEGMFKAARVPIVPKEDVDLRSIMALEKIRPISAAFERDKKKVKKRKNNQMSIPHVFSEQKKIFICAQNFRTPTPPSLSPSRTQNSWVYTPKVRLSPGKCTKSYQISSIFSKSPPSPIIF